MAHAAIESSNVAHTWTPGTAHLASLPHSGDDRASSVERHRVRMSIVLYQS
jgi:hypothetical protein